MNDDDLRACLAIVATMGLVAKHMAFDPKEPWRIAAAVLEARDQNDEEGIVAIKKRIKK